MCFTLSAYCSGVNHPQESQTDVICCFLQNYAKLLINANSWSLFLIVFQIHSQTICTLLAFLDQSSVGYCRVHQSIMSVDNRTESVMDIQKLSFRKEKLVKVIQKLFVWDIQVFINF